MNLKEKAKLHHDLIQLLRSCKTDIEFYNRLIYAKQLIESELSEFEIEVEDDYYDEYMDF